MTRSGRGAHAVDRLRRRARRAPRARGRRFATSPRSTGSRTRCSAARLLRAEHPDDAELAVAGLVHDIADIVYPDDHTDHDRRGAALVEPLLGAPGRAPRRRARDREALPRRRPIPPTGTQLSLRSVETLHCRATRSTTPTLARARRRIPTSTAILELRRADERAKDPTARVPGARRVAPRLLESLAR